MDPYFEPYEPATYTGAPDPKGGLAGNVYDLRAELRAAFDRIVGGAGAGTDGQVAVWGGSSNLQGFDSLKFVSGQLNLDGALNANKYVVQNSVDGTSARGIFMWTPTDTNWGIYMSQAGAGRSLADGTACSSGTGDSSHSVRVRFYNAAGRSFIVESTAERAEFSVNNEGYGYLRQRLGVGISPTAFLHVRGALTATGGQRLFKFEDSDTSGAGYVELYDGTSITPGFLPTLKFRSRSVGAGRYGLAILAEMEDDGTDDFGMIFDASKSTGALTSAPVAVFRNSGTEIARIGVGGEIISRSANAFRLRGSPYGAFWRIDSTYMYLLYTNSGDPDGTWNSLRPFYVENATGYCRMDHRLGIGGYPSYPLDILGNTGNYLMRIFNDGNSIYRYGMIIRAGAYDQSASRNIFVRFEEGDGTGQGYIVVNNSVLQFEQASDASLKEDIAASQISGLDIIDNLPVKEFRYKGKGGAKGFKHKAGFVAQDCIGAFPDMVSTDDDGKYFIAPTQLIPILTKAIQELKARVVALEGT